MAESIFPQTHWSAVLAAAGDDAAPARRAFEQLCGEYRDAIVRWMRLQRLCPEDAEDAAHDFLEQWLRRENPIQGFERGERRFREFLRVCLRRFLFDWHERRRARVRGGQAQHVTWEHDELVPDTADSIPLIDLALAGSIHQSALNHLASRWRAQVSGGPFDRLCAVSLGEAANPGYDKLAPEMGVAVGTLKSWVFRLRRDYYDAFRGAVSRQVAPEQVDGELHYLQRLLSQSVDAPPRAEQPPKL